MLDCDSKVSSQHIGDALMAVATRIAKGIPDAPVPRHPQEKQHQHAAHIQRMQAKSSVISFVPEDQHTYEVGQAALAMFESLPHPVQPDFVQKIDAHEQEMLDRAKSIAEAAGVNFDLTVGILPSTGY